jgi:hypothetical protein
VKVRANETRDGEGGVVAVDVRARKHEATVDCADEYVYSRSGKEPVAEST